MEIPSAISRLKRQVKEVPWDRMHPAFHLNTKFCHLLRTWEQKLPEQNTEFQKWMSESEKFVACLPAEYRARDGESLLEVDPFLELRQVFASNRVGRPSDIPSIVETMSAIAEEAGFFHKQDHENLVELACSSGLLSRAMEGEFFLRAGKQSSRESTEELIAEMQAEQVLGISTVHAGTHNTTSIYNRQNGLIEQSANESHIVLNGYGGCLCKFPLIISENDIVVLQPRDHQGTSVTNLAEPIYKTLHQYFPERRIHEAYEYDFDDGKDHISEITLDNSGHAQWGYSPDPTLSDLVRAHILQTGVEI